MSKIATGPSDRTSTTGEGLRVGNPRPELAGILSGRSSISSRHEKQLSDFEDAETTETDEGGSS